MLSYGFVLSLLHVKLKNVFSIWVLHVAFDLLAVFVAYVRNDVT